MGDKEDIRLLTDKILQIAYAVETLSGASVSFFDSNLYLNQLGIMAFIPKKMCHHDCEYCKFVRSLPGGRIRCINCDRREILDGAGGSQLPFLHNCHAGITEMAVPVMYRGRLIALAYLGQVRTSDMDENVSMALVELGAQQRECALLYSRLPMVELAALKAGALLLKSAIEGALSLLPELLVSRVFAAADASVSSYVKRIRNRRPDHTYTIREIADELFMSPEMLSRIYHKETGNSLKTELDDVSYFLAKRLLEEDHQSAAAVSANLGFSNENELRRWMKKRAKMHFAPSVDVPREPRQYARMAQEYLHEHYRDKVRVGDIAALLGISPDHLNRVFRKSTGQSLTEALWDMRLRSAENELLQDGATVSRVARQNGFGGRLAFEKRFYSKYNMSPELYMKISKTRNFDPDKK